MKLGNSIDPKQKCVSVYVCDYTMYSKYHEPDLWRQFLTN